MGIAVQGLELLLGGIVPSIIKSPWPVLPRLLRDSYAVYGCTVLHAFKRTNLCSLGCYPSMSYGPRCMGIFTCKRLLAGPAPATSYAVLPESDSKNRTFRVGGRYGSHSPCQKPSSDNVCHVATPQEHPITIDHHYTMVMHCSKRITIVN